MTHLFLINPAAGKQNRTEILSGQIRELCEKRVWTTVLLFPTPPATAAELPGKQPNPEKNTAFTHAAAMAP